MKKRNCKKIVEKFLNRQKGKSTHATPKEVKAYEGLSEDRDGDFYTIYDFDKICQLITEEFKGRVKSLPAEFSKMVDDNFCELI